MVDGAILKSMSDAPQEKRLMLHISVSKEINAALNELAANSGINKSEIIRRGIEYQAVNGVFEIERKVILNNNND